MSEVMATNFLVVAVYLCLDRLDGTVGDPDPGRSPGW
jgi:hypothetical protein